MDVSKDTKQQPPAPETNLLAIAAANMTPEQKKQFFERLKEMDDRAKVGTAAERELAEAKKREAEYQKREQQIKSAAQGQALAAANLFRELLKQRGRMNGDIDQELTQAVENNSFNPSGPAMVEVTAAIRDNMRGPVHQPAVAAAVPDQGMFSSDPTIRELERAFSSTASRRFEAQADFGLQPGLQQQPEVKASATSHIHPDSRALDFWINKLDGATVQSTGVPLDHFSPQVRSRFEPQPAPGASSSSSSEPVGSKRRRYD
jgi:hypothetical protein